MLITALACGLALLGPMFPPAASAQQPSSSPAKSSWYNPISGFSKLFQPSPPSAPQNTVSKDDPIALKNKAKAGPELFVAVARLYEQAGQFSEAEQQYTKALKQNPNYLPAILGYARLKEQLQQTDEALKWYQKALTISPRHAPTYNNLGLCYANAKRFDEAIKALGRAVQLEPRNVLYRNNLAVMLVERGRIEEALSHLRAVHNEANAYYNLGYLLQKKGQDAEAFRYFALALESNPSMSSAQRWLEHLQRRSLGQAETRESKSYKTDEIRTARRLPPVAPPPPELPALQPQEPEKTPDLPGISYPRESLPVAPLPPTR